MAWEGGLDPKKKRYCSKESLIFTVFFVDRQSLGSLPSCSTDRPIDLPLPASRGSDPVPISTQDPQPPGDFGKMEIPIFGKL
jgi:hypothetical protein